MSRKILSFNVLAPCWVKPEWYPGLDAELLDPKVRVRLNVDAIASRDSDLVCLQEVDAENHALLKAQLQEHGYVLSDISKNEPSSSPVVNGTAVAVKSSTESQFKISNHRIVDAGIVVIKCNPIVEILSSSSSSSSLSSSSTKTTVIVNVHIDQQEYGGSQQLKALLTYLVETYPLASHNIMIIGDMNIKREHLKQVYESCYDSQSSTSKLTFITPPLSACFPLTKPVMQLDHAVIIQLNDSNESCDINPEAHVIEDDSKEQVFHDALALLSQTDPSNALTHALLRWGSDHLPISILI